MPAVSFNELPESARVWIFASDRPLMGDDARSLLRAVDAFLDKWMAHGSPLRCAREWTDDRFLAIGVEPTVEQASGCSIDGLFRGLQSLERSLATRLVAGGRVFYRDANGQPQLAPRAELPTLAARGVLSADTPVFDTSITEAGAYRERFVLPVRDTWVASLLPAHASQASNRSATKSSSARKG